MKQPLLAWVAFLCILEYFYIAWKAHNLKHKKKKDRNSKLVMTLPKSWTFLSFSE